MPQAALASAAMHSSSSLAQRQPSRSAPEAELVPVAMRTAAVHAAAIGGGAHAPVHAASYTAAIGDQSAARAKASSRRSSGARSRASTELASPLIG